LILHPRDIYTIAHIYEKARDILKLKVSYSTKNRMKEICDGK